MFQQKTFKTHFFLFFALFVLWALTMQPVAFAAEGKLVFDTIHSPALEGNLLGDSADRSVIIYLPPSYETSPEKRYPVVYLFHGGQWFSNTTWVGGGYLPGFNIQTVMDRLIQDNKVREMILVMPSLLMGGWNTNAFYTNTPVLGNYEDFLTRDLVKWVEDRYRTLPQAASRGVFGHSLGGYGAIYLAMKHPEVYAAVYGHESSALVFESWMNRRIDQSALNITKSKDMNQFQGADAVVKHMFSIAASLSPNPENPPFFVDWPWELVDGQLKWIEPIWKKWLEYEPLTMITSLKPKLLELKAIRFDAGTSGLLIQEARVFDQALTAAGTPHIFEEFAGGHADRTAERIETKVLPFFSDVLAFEMLPVVSVHPKGKLAAMWGEMKRR